MIESFGQTAYEAYCKAVGGVSVHGDPLPTWVEQQENKPDVADAWQQAGEAVARRFVGTGV